MTTTPDPRVVRAVAIAISGAPFPTARSIVKAEAAIAAYLAATAVTAAPKIEHRETLHEFVQNPNIKVMPVCSVCGLLRYTGKHIGNPDYDPEWRKSLATAPKSDEL